MMHFPRKIEVSFACQNLMCKRPFQLHLWCQPAEPFCNRKAKKGSDWSLPLPPSQPWLALFKISCLFALGIQLQNSYLHPVSQRRLLHCAILQSQPRFLLDSLMFMIQGLTRKPWRWQWGNEATFPHAKPFWRLICLSQRFVIRLIWHGICRGRGLSSHHPQPEHMQGKDDENHNPVHQKCIHFNCFTNRKLDEFSGEKKWTLN